VTVADFTIDRPGLLEINRKIATMGGGDSHRVKKKASLCSASVCFFGGFGRFEIEGLPPQKKNIGGKAWAGPPTMISANSPKYGVTSVVIMV
jgi:hypothetical protein